MVTESSRPTSEPKRAQPPTAYQRSDGWVHVSGMMIYYVSLGQGTPLLVLHGGPGVSHDYFLPYLLPLATRHRLIFIDERGCGRSGRLRDPKGYTLEHMTEDVEAVRQALNLGRMALLGHSFGGILAQAYAIKYQQHLSKLILAGTAYSAAVINAEFQRIKAALRPEMRQHIETLEREGIYTPDGGYKPEYAKLATEAQRAYNFTLPPPGPAEVDKMSWDVLREMWVRHSDFVLDGNLSGFDFSEGLARFHLPTLIIVGDHDLVGESTAAAMQRMLPQSKLLVMRHAAHMMFVDLPESFLEAVEDFLRQ